MTEKRRYGFYGILIMVAVCSALAGIFIASTLGLNPVSEANPFWKEAASPARGKVPLPGFSSLAREVTPTVVNIRTTRSMSGSGMEQRFEPPPGYDEWFDEFFKKFFNNRPGQDLQQRSLGSGFIISPDGFVLTNNHVISGADEIFVSLADKEEFTATRVGTDDKTDIALIKIESEKRDFPVAVLGDSDALEIGEWVVALGNPFGFGHTLTQGIVSAKSRVIGAGPYDNFIQTDAAINPGNSGGPLINMQGQVIGINTAIVATGQGLGFATPINMAKDILRELKDTGEVARGWLGVAIQEVTPEIARAVGLKEHRGAMVTSVYAGDPADKAGIRPGDIILRIDGQDIADTRALTRIIGSLKPESAVKVTVFRDGRSRSLTAVLQKRTDDHVAKLDRSPRKEEGAKDPLGLTVVNITPQVQREFNIPEPAGVLVTDIDPKGSAAGSQIQKMDIIREVDRKEVNTVEHYLAALSARKKGQAVLLLVIRGSRPLYVAVDVK
ncbi:MAG TPA: DegQ family serine endoprotease [Deltaproteobacteria bacterium]|jgi:serine protease Do|nr:DegQ family serine endoprotease [Deltaproteobacteria bacterium]OQC27545.1 MAG: putative periplasmic serine endoprotease DegP-like precursor [Deltaproteobacteria bacterium ADurb.Bin072]NMD41282.1 DegQ family serine endoprotease [Deltaproteobacteria bacterium]HNQ86003.1 DegQ family serine endoprotease [Deltaproteobacteria bacterium]HNS90381.1 DegQ family serine endoprotease [Deltaproteobacteria bacterium]